MAKRAFKITHFVSSCSICTQTKTPLTLPSGKLVPLLLPTHPWTHLSVNFITDLPLSQNCTVILVIIDRSSKFMHLVPLAELPMVFQTAKLFEHVFSYFSLPEDIISDHRPQFTSRFWAGCMEKLGVTVSLTLYSRNSLIHSATRLTPFQCILWFQPPLYPGKGNPTEAPAVDEWFRRSEQIWEQTHQHLETTVKRLLTTK